MQKIYHYFSIFFFLSASSYATYGQEETKANSEANHQYVNRATLLQTRNQNTQTNNGPISSNAYENTNRNEPISYSGGDQDYRRNDFDNRNQYQNQKQMNNNDRDSADEKSPVSNSRWYKDSDARKAYLRGERDYRRYPN